jgi:hypothetical protein
MDPPHTRFHSTPYDLIIITAAIIRSNHKQSLPCFGNMSHVLWDTCFYQHHLIYFFPCHIERYCLWGSSFNQQGVIREVILTFYWQNQLRHREKVAQDHKFARWGDAPVISELGRLWQEDCKFKASLGYIVRSCLKEPTFSPKKIDFKMYWGSGLSQTFLLPQTYWRMDDQRLIQPCSKHVFHTR